MSLLCLTCFISCECDNDTIFCNNESIMKSLEGDWEVVSYLHQGLVDIYGYQYTVLEEQMSDVFATFTLEFGEYKDDSANFKWVQTGANGLSRRLEGDFTANSAEDELDFDFDANALGYNESEMTFYINEDELMLTGMLKDKSVIIRAERD